MAGWAGWLEERGKQEAACARTRCAQGSRRAPREEAKSGSRRSRRPARRWRRAFSMWLRGVPRADRGDTLGRATEAEPRWERRSPGRRGGTGKRPGPTPFPRHQLVLWALLRRGQAHTGRGGRYWGVLGMGGRAYRATWAPHAATEVRGRAKGRARARASGRTCGHRAVWPGGGAPRSTVSRMASKVAVDSERSGLPQYKLIQGSTGVGVGCGGGTDEPPRGGMCWR